MEEKQEQIEIDKDAVRIEAVRNFLCSYQLSADMLHLKRYERKRAYQFDDEFDCEDILAGNEAYWRARMYAVGNLIEKMKNGRNFTKRPTKNPSRHSSPCAPLWLQQSVPVTSQAYPPLSSSAAPAQFCGCGLPHSSA